MVITRLIRPTILQVETTNDCNLNCKICMRRHLRRPVGYMSFEDFKTLPLKEFKEICLHGWGEPLLHPDIFKFVKYVKSLGLKASLGTNGLLVDKRMDEIFESGLDEIAFGIYTLKGKSKVIENLRELVEEKKKRKAKLTIYIDITIWRDNLEEIPEIVKLGLDIGVDGIVLHRVFNIYGVDPDVHYISEEEEKQLFETVKKIGGKRVYLPIKHFNPCRVVLHTMFVTWDFKQTPCVFLSEYYLGDAKGIDFKTMLERHLKFVSKMRSHDICSKCFW